MSFANVTSLLIYSWTAVYLVLMVHGSTLTSGYDFYIDFIIVPVMIGMSLAIYEIIYIKSRKTLVERIRHIGISDNEYTILIIGIIIYTILPISIVSLCMMYANNVGSYDGMNWMIYSFGGVLVKEIIEKLYDNHR